MAQRYWLMKTEPDVFSFDDLVRAPHRTECWDGVRNYQARNFMRDQFKKGDGVLIYHSRIADPAIVGIAEVVREAYPDKTALDPNEKYFDPKSFEQGKSRWVVVDVKAKGRLKNPITLSMIKNHDELKNMMVAQKGVRLSIQPVEKKHWDLILKLGQVDYL